MLNHKIIVLVYALMLWCSCSHSIHMVNTSGFAPYGRLKQGRLIRAESQQKSILGFNRDTNYVDEAYWKLRQKCKKGEIKSITTQFSTSHGLFHWYNKILMQGLCVRS